MNTFFSLTIRSKKEEYIGLFSSLASALETGRALEGIYQIPYTIVVSEWLWNDKWEYIDTRIEEEVE